MCQMSTNELQWNVEKMIKGYTDVPKLLGEWRLILNENLPKSRRFTPRELARLFIVFKKQNRFIVEHSGQSYVFHSTS